LDRGSLRVPWLYLRGLFTAKGKRGAREESEEEKREGKREE